MNLRPYIRGTLWAGGLLVIALGVAGALWLILGAVGDQPGSQGTKGVALVAIVGLVLDVFILNVLLALAELARPNAGLTPAPHDAARKEPHSDGHTSSDA